MSLDDWDRTTRHKLAILINFDVKVLKNGIKRIAL